MRSLLYLAFVSFFVFGPFTAAEPISSFHQIAAFNSARVLGYRIYETVPLTAKVIDIDGNIVTFNVTKMFDGVKVPLKAPKGFGSFVSPNTYEYNFDFSLDGQSLLIGKRDDGLSTFDTATGQLRNTPKIVSPYTKPFYLSANTVFIAFDAYKSAPCIYDLTARACEIFLDTSKYEKNDLNLLNWQAPTSDGHYAMALGISSLHIWDLHTGKEVDIPQMPKPSFCAGYCRLYANFISPTKFARSWSSIDPKDSHFEVWSIDSTPKQLLNLDLTAYSEFIAGNDDHIIFATDAYRPEGGTGRIVDYQISTGQQFDGFNTAGANIDNIDMSVDGHRIVTFSTNDFGGNDFANVFIEIWQR